MVKKTKQPPELLVALTDDWELRGNGQGSVKALQYEPAKKLMALYNSLGVTATFNVEVMQQMAFIREAVAHNNLSTDVDDWEKGLNLIHEQGFDIQLHLHPQWKHAKYNGKTWLLDTRWNIGVYPENEIRSMIEEGIKFLESRLDKKILSFRSGGWASYPSKTLMSALKKNGILLDVSIVNGLYNNGDCSYIDYRNLASPYTPYYPTDEDIKIPSASEKGILEIPTQSVADTDLGVNDMGSSWPSTLTRLKAQLKRWKLSPWPSTLTRLKAHWKRWKLSHPAPRLADLSSLDPFGYQRRLALQDIILDFSAKITRQRMEQAINFALKRAIEQNINVLIFENHTKDLQTDEAFENIACYVNLIKNCGAEVKFVTLDYLARNRSIVNLHHAS